MGKRGLESAPSLPAALACPEPSFPWNLDQGWGPGRGDSQRATEKPAKHPALTSLQLGHPLQQRVQGALGLLPVSRGLVVEQGLLVLQLRHLAQQLPLQVPEPPLEHVSEVAGQRGRRHVPSELVLGVRETGRRSIKAGSKRNCETQLHRPRPAGRGFQKQEYETKCANGTKGSISLMPFFLFLFFFFGYGRDFRVRQELLCCNM